jgi:DNA polymerase elongation subunit (family B)
VISTLILDLETTDLDADRGVILCASYESSKRPGKVKTLRQDVTSPTWKKGDRGNDKELVKQICKLVREHDIIVAHNGSRFDIPMLRTRALRWGLTPLKEVKLIDPCSIAWRKFKLRSNSLGRIADYVGIKDKKTPLDMSTWADATLRGCKKAMNLIVEHCEADIRVLSGVLNFVKPFIKLLDEKGSAL